MLLITVATTALPRRRPSAFICLAHISMHVVAVQDPAAGVDENRAIAVAVEGDAEPVPACCHRLRQLVRMRRAARLLMFRPSGAAR